MKVKDREKERQRARARDKRQRRHFWRQEQHENFVAVVRKREMLAATKVLFVKMSRSEKRVNMKLLQVIIPYPHFFQPWHKKMGSTWLFPPVILSVFS